MYAELKIDEWTQHGYAYCRHEWDGAGAAENIDRIDDSEVSEANDNFSHPIRLCVSRGH